MSQDFAQSSKQKLWELHCLHRDSYIRSIKYYRRAGLQTGRDYSAKIDTLLGYIAEIDAKYPGKFEPVE